MSARRPRTEQVSITGIAAGGEGVGRLADGRVVFVHRTAPDELVEVQVMTERSRWARGRLLRVIEASPARREAPCPHYAECGGCTLEHLRYEAQLALKGRIVSDALSRIGGFEPIDVEVIPSPTEFRYRNRVSFALRRGSAGQVVAGFHALRDPDRIVPIDGACLLPELPISEVWDRLRAHWGPDANRLPSGERLRLTLRASSDGRVSLLVQGGFSHGRPAELIDGVDGLEAIWYQSAGGTAEHVAGPPGLPEVWGDESFDVGGAAFLQVNRGAAALLEDHVLRVAGEIEGLRVVDAYCGVGLHARRFARAGAAVTGIELDTEAVRIASETGIANARFIQGRVEEILPSALPADLLVLNPPRAGIDVLVAGTILDTPPARIIYVSCDPATLARDLKRLSGGFEISGVRCFDLFPQTSHVESVVHLRRRAD